MLCLLVFLPFNVVECFHCCLCQRCLYNMMVRQVIQVVFIFVPASIVVECFYCCLLPLFSFIIVVCIISWPGKLFRLSGHARPCRRSCPVEVFVRDQNIICRTTDDEIKNGSMTNRPTFPSDAVMFLRCRLHADGASSSNSLCPQQQLHFQDSSNYNSYNSTALSRLSCLDVLFGSLGCTSASVDVVPVPFSPNDAAATNAVSYDCCPCLPAAPVIVASLPLIGWHRMLVRPGWLLIGRHNPANS